MRHEHDRMVHSPPFLPSLASSQLEGPSRMDLYRLTLLIRPPPF